MLAFDWKFFDYKLNKLQGISQKIMFAPFLFTNIFGRYGKYIYISDILC